MSSNAPAEGAARFGALAIANHRVRRSFGIIWQETTMTKDQMPETGPWDAALAQIREWDPAVGGDLREDDHQSVELRPFCRGRRSS